MPTTCEPAYLSRLHIGKLQERVRIAYQHLEDCDLQRRTTCHSEDLRRTRKRAKCSDFPLLCNTSPFGMNFAR